MNNWFMRNDVDTLFKIYQGGPEEDAFVQLLRDRLARELPKERQRAQSCYDCGEFFNALRRRHHCRACGHSLCGAHCRSVNITVRREGVRDYRAKNMLCVPCLAKERTLARQHKSAVVPTVQNRKAIPSPDEPGASCVTRSSIN